MGKLTMTDFEGVEAEVEVSAPSAAENDAKDSAPVEESPAPQLTAEQRAEQLERETAALKKRIARQTAANREAQRQRDEMAKIVEQYKPKDTSPKPPSIDDFNSTEEYLVAKGRFEAKQEFEQAQQKQAQEAQQRAAYEARVKFEQEFEQKQAQAREIYPDYDEAASVVNDILVEIPDGVAKQAFSQFLIESDKTTHLIHYLGKNPDVAEKLMGLSPIGAIKELARIEDKLAANATRKPEATKQTKPISPIRSTGTSSKGVENMTPKELVKWLDAKS